MMKEYVFLEQKYLLVQNVREGFEEDAVKEALTEYYLDFDYVVGDWAYGKLRLKGFNKKNHPHFKDMNDYAKLEEYIGKYCAANCRWFSLEKEKN